MKTLKIVNDVDAENPRTEWDGQCPLITNWGRDFWDKSYWIDIVDFVSKRLNNKNMYKILEAMWYTKDDIYKERQYTDTCNREIILNRISSDIWYDMDIIESILDILKVRNYRRTSRWYSQWYCISCIIVYTDDYIKEIGIKKKDIYDAMKWDKKLFDAWAWWDVYGFQIIEHKPLYHADGTLSSETEDEIVESCYWFYGDDGLDTIQSEVACYWITIEQFENAKENIQ